MTRIAVSGAAGRMGRAVVGLVLDAPDLDLVAAIERPASPAVGADAGMLAGRASAGTTVTADLGAALAGADVLIDFSAPEGALAVVAAVRAAGKPAVIGTTGIDVSGRAAIASAARDVAVVFAPNMSAGVTVLLGLVEQAVRALGAGHDVEIVETHHRAKQDAPSGTALALAQAAARAQGHIAATSLRTGREGQVGARPDREIGVLALRGGDVVGDHTVHLLALGERLELTHRATSRETFARGALRAARWILDRPPGLYDMRDVLGLPR